MTVTYPSNSTSRQCRRPRQNRNRVWLASVLAIASFAADTTSFVAMTTTTRSKLPTDTTRRFFRTPEGIGTPNVEYDIASTIISQSLMTQPTPYQAYQEMPPWLRVPQGHLFEENLSKLRKAMTDSFFTENEAHKILFAIQGAAKSDRNKIAGAADFLLILVETMEMGVNALVAAAYHYCSCVTAREMDETNTDDQETFWDTHELPSGIYTFGDHTVSIAQDAARLKKIETVTASLTRNTDKENVRNLLLTETRDWRALAIRSGASLYRLRGILSSGHVEITAEINRVAREALHIYAPLASRLGMHRLKNELEEAAFRIIYKRQYKTATSLALQSRRISVKGSNGSFGITTDPANAQYIGDSMKEVLNGVTAQVRDMLQKDPAFSKYSKNVVVTARVKEAYSMWQKMLRTRAHHILEIPDSMALRIVLEAKESTPNEDNEVTRARDRALCYYAQQLCMKRFQPAKEARVKDYIEKPKPNGYQSLHYIASTEYGGDDWSFEIQVRSHEMHKVAEFGFASHWDYKANTKTQQRGSEVDEGQTKSNSHGDYLKSLQEWHWQQQSASSSMWSDATPATSVDWAHADDEGQAKIRADRISARTDRLAPYIEAFTEAQSVAREQVFVFLSRSGHLAVRQVMALPAGACVLDALRTAELNVHARANDGVVHNGMVANVHTKLQNGDVLVVSEEMMGGALA